MLNVFFASKSREKAVKVDENEKNEQTQTKQLERSKKLLEHINEVNKYGLIYE